MVTPNLKAGENMDSNDVRLKNLKPFQFGNKMNPGKERIKAVAEALKYARSKSKDALRIAWVIACDDTARNQDRLKAIEIVLDRGLGKPVQLNITDEATLSKDDAAATARLLLNEMLAIQKESKTIDVEADSIQDDDRATEKVELIDEG